MGRLKQTTNAEILSLIINSNPELKANLDLPVEGESTAKYGDLIIGNPVYRNQFINSINQIGVTVVKKNGWDNPWEWFTNKGMLKFGQQVREMIVDLADVFDYNEFVNDNTKFLETVVPDVYSYVHEVNYEKVYRTTTNDVKMAMAFTSEDGLYNLITEIIDSLWDSYQYDLYIVNKYMLCRRILNGTVPPSYIANYNSLTERQRVSKMKAVANKFTFKNPNYNPAGVRRANRMEDLILIMNTDFEATLSTEVLATSFFRNDAEFKTNGVLVDGFGNHDVDRLVKLLKNDFVPFTSEELSKLASIPAVLISMDFFMDYYYSMGMDSGTKNTEFYNPTTHKANYFLSVMMVLSTSPFEQATVFTLEDASVDSISVSPSTATITKGQELKLSASVETEGFGNKAVAWEINSQAKKSGATIDSTGLLKVPSNYTTESGTQGVYTLTISTALATTDVLVIDGLEYSPEAGDDTATKQATAIKNAFSTSTEYTVTSSSGVVTFTEKSGYYGTGAPVVDDSEVETGEVAEATTTEGKESSTPIVVTATSILDKTKNASARITVA